MRQNKSFEGDKFVDSPLVNKDRPVYMVDEGMRADFRIPSIFDELNDLILTLELGIPPKESCARIAHKHWLKNELSRVAHSVLDDTDIAVDEKVLNILNAIIRSVNYETSVRVEGVLLYQNAANRSADLLKRPYGGPLR